MLKEEWINFFEEIDQIYASAFPEAERRTKAGQKKAMGRDEYRLRVIREGGEKDRKGKICGFLGYWELPSCIFLEHLATLEAFRGKGYGRILVEQCIQEGEEKRKPLFLEIEPVTPDDPMTGRRERFYQRCGFFTNHFAYLQMPLKEGDRPIPLWVMSWPKPVEEGEFFPYKKEIYRTVYGIQKIDLNTK